MPISRYLMLIPLLLSAYHPASGAEPATAPIMGTMPGETTNPMLKVLPEVRFDGMSVDDVLKYLQDVSPGFEAVVVRNGDEFGPVTMNLRNVTVQQVLEVLQLSNSSSMDIRPVEEGRAPSSIYVVRGRALRATEPPVLRVYRLQPVIETMGGGEKKSLDDILSLVQATLSAISGPSAPTLQVHEATNTLIFKGSGEQEQAVNQALEALCPGITTNSFGGGGRGLTRSAGTTSRRTSPVTEEKSGSTQNPGETKNPGATKNPGETKNPGSSAKTQP